MAGGGLSVRRCETTGFLKGHTKSTKLAKLTKGALSRARQSPNIVEG
jgi:hypothetical protein